MRHVVFSSAHALHDYEGFESSADAEKHEYEQWMQQDFAWIARADCVLRLPGESSGADREVAHAKALSKPVFYSVAAWREHHKDVSP